MCGRFIASFVLGPPQRPAHDTEPTQAANPPGELTVCRGLGRFRTPTLDCWTTDLFAASVADQEAGHDLQKDRQYLFATKGQHIFKYDP